LAQRGEGEGASEFGALIWNRGRIMATFTHRMHSKYTPAQLFDLVADVERYPEFIPWMITTRVRRRTERLIWTDLTIGTGFLRKQFSTVATLDRPHQIAISSHDLMFERFEQKWTFNQSTEAGTDVEYRVDFALKSFVLQALMDVTFADRATKIVSAYTRRARRLYG
jgi:coenzyme Q-binding protein COQ10